MTCKKDIIILLKVIHQSVFVLSKRCVKVHSKQMRETKVSWGVIQTLCKFQEIKTVSFILHVKAFSKQLMERVKIYCQYARIWIRP